MVKLIFSLSSFSFLGYAIGFINQIIIANKFGTSAELDIYLLALSVVNFGWFFVGPINEISIPDLFKYTKSSYEDGSLYFSKILNIILIFSAVMSILLYLFLSNIFDLISFDLNIDYLQFRENVLFLLPIIFLTALTQYFQIVLNSMSKYIAQSIGKVVTASISVLFLLFFFDYFGIKAIILGLELGLLVLALLQFYFISKLKVFYRPFCGVITDKTYYKHISALSFTYLLSALQLVYERFVFMSFGDGVLSSYNYSQALLQVPQMIVVTGVVAIVWTNIMNKIHENDINKGLDELLDVAINSFIISMYIALTISIFSKEIIYVIFKSGNFNENSLEITSQILRISIFLLPLIVFNNIIGRAFSAFKKVNIMLAISFLLSALTFIVLFIGYYFGDVYLTIFLQLIVNLVISLISLTFLKKIYTNSHTIYINYEKAFFTMLALFLVAFSLRCLHELLYDIESKFNVAFYLGVVFVTAFFMSILNVKYIKGIYE